MPFIVQETGTETVTLSWAVLVSVAKTVEDSTVPERIEIANKLVVRVYELLILMVIFYLP